MTASRFRKKPLVIDAIQYTGSNWDAVWKWFLGFHKAQKLGQFYETDGHRIKIGTQEGTMFADANDWIIRGVKGEFYPCKPDIFEETYEPAEIE
jgi:hypothetical protein